MKRLALFLTTLVIAVGCACSITKASDPVKEYLEKFNNHDSEVLVELDELLKEEKLSDELGDDYKSVMKKQYTDLKYEIVSENYNGDEATVTTKITVYDLYKAQQDAENYRVNNKNEFKENDDFLKYKIEQMNKSTDRVEYTIDFPVKKEDGKWTLKGVSTEDLEKIHGIYNYQND